MIISTNDLSKAESISYMSTPSPGFFYLFILKELNRTSFKELSEHDINLVPLYQTPTKYYFNEGQIEYLFSQEWALLKKLKQKYRTLDFTDFQNKDINDFTVIAPPHWDPNYARAKHITNLTYLVTQISNLSQLYSDPAIDSITPIFPPKFTNRYVSGFVQDRSSEFEILNDQTISKQTLHNIGLTGENVIVSLFDNGMSVYSYPPHRLLTKANVTMQFNTETQDLDHGTHCAGTIAGSIDDKTSRLSLYQGVAPGAGIQSWLAHDFTRLLDTPKFQNSVQYITSNSWGQYPFDKTAYQPSFKGCFFYQFLVDQIFLKFPETLFVFAAGNEGPYSIIFPSVCKNVLTVGATNGAPISVMEFQRRWYLETSSGRSVRCEDFPYGVDPYFQNPLLKLRNLTNYCLVSDSNNVPPCATDPDTKLVVLTDSKFGDYAKTVPVAWVPSFKLNSGESISLYSRPAATFDDRTTAPFSSRYPTQHGLMKPDLSAPGTNTVSADAYNPEGLKTLSGTSMATPAVSGLAALLRQYFIEGWYPKNVKGSGDPIRPFSMLMKAVLVNSAVKIPNDETTTGEPDLSYGIGFKSAGFRCYQGKIQQKEVKKFIIRTTKIEQFSVTMSWLDVCPKSIQKWEDDLLPTCGDLDLLVIAPNKKVYSGNEMSPCETDMKEKVLIKNAMIGEYEIYVMSSTPFENEYQFAVAVTGGFDQKSDSNMLTPINVNDPVLECRNGGEPDGAMCKCKSGYHGNFCEEKYEDITGDTITFTLKAGQVRYFHYQSPYTSGYFNVLAPYSERMYSTLFASTSSSFQKICFSTQAWRWRKGELGFHYGSISEMYFALVSGTSPEGEEFTMNFKSGPPPPPPPTKTPIIPTETPEPTETPILPTDTPMHPTETLVPPPPPTEAPLTPSPVPPPKPTLNPTSEIVNPSDSEEEPDLSRKKGLSTKQTIAIASGVSVVVIGSLVIVGVYFLRKGKQISLVENPSTDIKEELLVSA